jgi:UDP-N-acetylglucosamine 3-dehydrogenase
VAQGHLAAWRRIPYAKIVAVCDTNAKAVERVAKDWKIPRSFTSTSEISGYKEATLWDICTPIQTHKYVAIEAMKNGYDVLIEKPMTITSDDARDIVDCQKATGKTAGVIHNWLFEPPILKARTIINRGDIGEVIGAHIGILHTKDEPMASNKDHWSHQLPGGRFSEMLIHPIYLLRSFLGQIQVSNVEVSKIGEYQWMKQDELTATFRAGKKLASVYVSFNAPRNSIYLDIFGRRGILRLDVITATLVAMPSANMNRMTKAFDSVQQAFQLSSSTFGNALKILSRRWFDGHEMCIRLFAQSIVEGGEPPVSVQEGYEVVKVLEDMSKRLN